MNSFVSETIKSITKMTESALFSCKWLQQNLYNENQVILDATFFLPRQKRNAQNEYQKTHILGALFFDIDKIADLTTPLPHTLPSAEQFAEAVGMLGIDNNTQVIIYDNNHFFASARVWWLFRVFGHHQVQVLDGGLACWLQKTYPIDSSLATLIRKNFVAKFHPELVCNLEQMLKIQQTASRQILDSRSQDSFSGFRPASSPDLKLGHIPGSINIPYASLTCKLPHTLLAKQALLTLFENTGINLTRSIVTSCGSGVSAAVLALALYQIGVTEVPVYDGSWAEWGRQSGTPKQTGD
jgi:thiosulfate/3-mercaptopyruvate sulfurtransferase